MFLSTARTLLAGSLVLAIASPLAAAEASKIFELPYEMRELDNGLRVVVVPTDTPGVVSLQIPVQTGSRNEVEKGKSGFAHFFEHMMFRGTEANPPEVYQAIIKNAGADQNAYTSADLTNYHINFTTDDLAKIIEVEADRFQNLSYSEEQFRTEALAVKGEYLKNFSNPMSKGFEKLSEIAFDVHTYGHTTMGYFADIEEMPNQMEYSKIFFDRWYRPEYTTVIVVGDVEIEPTMALVKQHWGDWKRGSYSVDIPQEGPLDGPRDAHIAWEGPTLPLMLHSWRGPALTMSSTDSAALMLLAEIYFGPTSDIYQQLVVRERLVDQFFAIPPRSKDPGLFTIGSRLTSADNAAAVVAAIQATQLKARTELLDPAKLAETKSRSKYGFAATLNSASSIGATLAQFVHYERDPETLNRLYAQFDAVTPEDIRKAANRVFIDSNRASVSIANGDALAGADAFRPLDAEAARILATPAKDTAFELVERPSESALIDVALIVKAGSRFDPPGKNGLAQLTAAMLTQAGTVKRSFAEVQQGFYPLAAGWGAQVDQEIIKLAGTVHRDNAEAWYALVRELLLEPGFREEDFARLKTQLVNGIRQNLRANNDEELGKEALYEMVYGPSHPYGRLPMGYAGEIETLTLDDVRGFYRQHYVRGAITIGLGGGFDEVFKARLLADLNKLPDSEVSAAAVPSVVPAKARAARIIEKETPAVAVSFGWPIDVRRGHPDWAALWLVRSYLGEHRNSSALLYQRIRETRGMNYGNYAYTEYFPNGMYMTQPSPNYPRQNDLLQIWLRPLRDNNDALFATRAALFEIDKLRRDGISEEDFEATRTYLRKYVAILTATSSRRLGYALDSHWFETADFVDYVRAELEKLSHAQVNEVIRKYLDSSAAQFVFVAKDAEGLATAIAEDRASPITYNTEKPAQLMEEDAVISAMPLKLPRSSVQVIKAETVFE